jgi:prephenate dehydrogenase
MRTVAIAGVGLIGGSFALALREAGFAGEIWGVSSPRTVEAAVRRGAVDRGATLEEAVEGADLIYLAQPISKILEAIPKLAGAREGALVTDAGSTKGRICRAAREHIRRAQFLGGHPMAGKEARGVEAAEAGLFRGRTYFVTPREVSELETPVAREFVEWVRKIGANVVPIAPGAHDHLVARTSHLPQMISTALAVALSESLGGAAKAGAGPGLMDMSRLAMSAWEIWADIVETNSGEIGGALDMYMKALEEVRERLRTGNLRDPFEIGAIFAKSLRDK